MKRVYIISIVSILALSIYSCTRIENGDIDKVEPKVFKVFQAYLEGGNPETKTTLGGDAADSLRKIYWEPNDTIAVSRDTYSYSGGAVPSFANTTPDTSRVGNFTGYIEDERMYYAFYPNKKDLSYTYDSWEDSRKFTFNLPEKQIYGENTFGSSAFPMVGKLDTASVTPHFVFKNLCGILVINLKGTETVKSLTFKGKDSTGVVAKVSGKAIVDPVYADQPVMVMDPNAGTTVTLDCQDGVTLSETDSTSFYMVLPPGTYSSFSVTIATSDGKIMHKGSDKPLTIKRSGATFATSLTYVEMETSSLSDKGTANSYIVSAPGVYDFNASVIGNGAKGIIDTTDFHTTDVAINPASAELLWQDIAEPISNVTYNPQTKRISFLYTGTEGNAVIAAKDDSGNIIWSWHIWGTDTPAEIIYGQDAGVMMDRNVGAISATPGDVGAIGLLFQWGRKDPFIGAGSISSNSRGKTTITWPGAVYSSTDNGTINYTINHPTTFIKYNSSNNDWFYTGDGTTNNTRWNTKKTIYDPCPVGWRVPNGGPDNIWEKANFANAYTYHSNYYGLTFPEAMNTWYPLTGYISYSSGNLTGVGSNGGIWSCTPADGAKIYEFDIQGGYTIVPASPTESRAYGGAVRCIKDENYVDVTMPIIALDTLTSITSTGATITATIDKLDGIIEKGFVLGTSEHPTVDNNYAKVANTQDTLTFTSDLEFEAGDIYYVRAFATNENGTSYSEELSFLASDADNPMDLSAYGTANSYIINKYGYYKFKHTVRGNSTEPTGTAGGVSVLWETTNTLTAVAKGEVIKSVKLSGDYVIITLPDTFTPGNAVIAIKDNLGTILWSWHIWVVDFDPIATQQRYISGAVMMDRNLGALSIVPGEVETYGLLYQWGRKDPFTGAGSVGGTTHAATHPANVITYAVSTEATGTVEYTIKNPTKVLYDGPDNDWHYPFRVDTLWSSHKTMYDPCPPGWRVPDGGMGVWSGFTSRSSATDGYKFYQPNSDPVAYYPSIKNVYSGGSLSDSQRYWSCSTTGKNAYHFYTYNYKGYEYAARDYEMGIRCTKDQVFSVKTLQVHSITDTTATVTVKITLDEGASTSLAEVGVVISTDHTMLDKFRSATHILEIPSEGEVEVPVTGLSHNVIYYVRGYATDETGTRYGNIVQFKSNMSGEGNEGLGNEEYEW